MGNETDSKEVAVSQEVLTFTVDSFADGIAWGQHLLPEGEDPRDYYGLHLADDSSVVQLRSRYSLHKQNPLIELEKHLMGLSRQGVLGSSCIILGTTTDPFYPFEGKFDASMRFLELFQRYTPGMLYVQTRSPLLVIALPVFKKLGSRCAITIGLETHQEDAVSRYTPGMPRISERLKTATALRRFGVEVNLQVSPVLPYGDWEEDADEFADVLIEHGNSIYVRSITDGSERCERKVRASALAKRLADDRKFHWLRPDSARPLIDAIERKAPEKLLLPERPQLKKKQVEMFAA